MGTGGSQGAFGESGEMPTLFEFAEGGVFNQGTPVVQVEHTEQFADIQARGKDRLVGLGIGLGPPVGDDQRLDGVGLEIGMIQGQLVRRIAVWY
jgi:hypothetical protein